ncbi:MAG: glycosyl hydrolase family 8 [Acidobacteriaceae bacterium]
MDRSKRAVRFAGVCLGVFFLTATCLPLHAQQARRSSVTSQRASANGSGAFATGRYPNPFREAGHSQAQIDAKINAAFAQLFHGDKNTQTVYYAAGTNANGPLAYITDVAHHDVRTEGMSYGMMISVQLNKKAEFDALWNWAMTYMYISNPKHPAHGYFSWSCKTNGEPNEETPAPDGEEYFVMSLYFASARWGNGPGIYNYKPEADAILTNMRHHAVMSGPTKFGPRTIGSMVNEQYKMIRFVPGMRRGDFTDPSYHLPAFYELWARWGPKRDRAFWAQAAAVSRNFFEKTTNPKTGLAPNYANFDGTPHAMPWSRMSSNFGFDAWRTASNWSVDWSWWRKAPGERELSDRIQKFFLSQGIATYGDEYTLDGRELEARHSTGLVATNAVASLAATGPQSKQFVKALWDAPIPSGEQRYYDGMLYLMSLMHCGGEFRIWTPK